MPAPGFRRTSEQVIHEGFVWNLVSASFEAPDGATFDREIVRSPGAVGVVPIVFDAEGNPSVVLVSQYRPPYDEYVLELPAGLRDVDGEDPADVARRELIEEAGLQAGDVELLVAAYPSPGMTDSVISIFLATGCTVVPTQRHGPEEDFMEIVHLPFDDALAMVDRGDITDSKTVIGLLMTERRLRASDGSS